ncbi:MAG TPA: hypothetical protein VGJ15_13825 [Pirellulales bacterium]|jgi:hypothetical protein
MQAALISLVLMSGACGQLPDDENYIAPPEIGSFQPDGSMGVTVSRSPVTVSMPVISHSASCPSCGQPNNAGVPPSYRGCPQYSRPENHVQPAWETPYHPAWYFYCRMLFHPADYTQPYPYREQFDYPWHDPRCTCATLPVGY